MHKTPQWIYDEIAQERPPCERAALLHDHVCQGRSTMEHVWIYGGKQISDQKWAIIRLCWWAHLGAGLNKSINRYISLRHATPEDLRKFPRINWIQIRTFLNAKYDKLCRN